MISILSKTDVGLKKAAKVEVAYNRFLLNDLSELFLILSFEREKVTIQPSSPQPPPPALRPAERYSLRHVLGLLLVGHVWNTSPKRCP